MLKKILIALFILIVGVFFYFKFWVLPKVMESIPEVLSQMQEDFEDMCNKSQDNNCLIAVREHYQKCSSRFMPKDLAISNYKKELNGYIENVHRCIESESKSKLPSIWDYIHKYKN
jgi:hypothetical protein